MSVNKDKILEGALSLFSDYGFTKVSMDELSRHLGISKKTIYNHFTNKETLAEEVLKFGADTFIRQMEAVTLAEGMNFSDKLHTIMDIASNGIKKRERIFFIDGTYSLVRGLRDPIDYLRDRIIQMIHKLLTQGQNQGIIRLDISLDKLVYVLFNMLVGAISWDISETGLMTRTEILKESIKIIFEGLFTPAWRDRPFPDSPI